MDKKAVIGTFSVASNQTPARVRTDYMHKLQTMYEAALVQCKQIAENPATAAREKAIVIKRISKITKQLEETKLYDQALGHIASQYIDIDLDDGVNVNYEKFQSVQVAKEVDAISCDDFNVNKHNTADFRLSYVKVFNVRM